MSRSSEKVTRVKEDSPRRYLQAGACLAEDDATVLVACRLEASQCPEGSVFRSSRQLLTAGGPGAACLDQTRTIPVGRCESQTDRMGCAIEAKACTIPTKFTPVSDGCTVDTNLLPDDESSSTTRTTSTATTTESRTRFPECDISLDGGTTRVEMCIYRGQDCSADLGGYYVPPYAPGTIANWHDCYCENVETGACLFQGTYYCAVSADGCDIESVWTSLEVMKGIGTPNDGVGIDCRLCAPEKVKDSSDNKIRWIVGSSLAVLVVAGLITAVTLLLKKKRQQLSTSKSGTDKLDNNKMAHQGSDSNTISIT